MVQVFVFEGDWVDGDDCGGGIGPVLREGGPNVLAVIIDGADVVFDIAWLG